MIHKMKQNIDPMTSSETYKKKKGQSDFDYFKQGLYEKDSVKLSRSIGKYLGFGLITGSVLGYLY